MDAFFFPNKENVDKIVNYINMATKELKICVYNITNDKLANAVLARFKAGISVQVISDDVCMHNQGSDVKRFADAGIPCRTDSSRSHHMHDKFMVVDNSLVLTGSFNWTY
jgi:cardiolipin hydrolase